MLKIFNTRAKRITRKRKKVAANSLQFHALEPRKLLASVAFNGGVLEVIGDNANDNVHIVGNTTTYNSFTMTVNGASYGPYSYSAVARILVLGGNGNDTINNESHEIGQFNGQAGHDIISGGYSHDYIRGGTGVDTIYGRAGDDRIFGDGNKDWIYGGPGADALNGGSGNDVMRGGSGNDHIGGINGADELFGDSGNDTIYGNAGDDEIHGGAGNDKLYGGYNNDDLYGNGGVDDLFGEAGKDGLFGGIDDVQDFLSGGADSDRLLVEGTLNFNNFTGLSFTDSSSQDGSDAIILIHGTGPTSFEGNSFTAGDWTDQEIFDIDPLLKSIHFETTDADLLQYNNGGLGFIALGRLGQQTAGSPFNAVNASNGAIAFTDNGLQTVDQARSSLAHEISHNFDEQQENPFINNFRALSSWTNQSGTWEHDPNAEFARPNGSINPREDYATTFEAYIMNKYFGNPFNDNLVTDKIDNVELYIDSLG